MTRKIVIWAFFNVDPGWANNPYKEARLTKEWIDYRMGLFMNYTCKSFRMQSNQDFLALIAYDPKTEALIQEALAAYEPLPDNIRFITNLYAETCKACVGYDRLYHMRIDSDNMIHPDFVSKLWAIDPGEDTEVIIPQWGYVYDVIGGGLCEFYQESPPFYTLIYKEDEYRKGKSLRGANGHAGMIQLNHEILEGHNFMVLVHKQNILNRFDGYLCHRPIEIGIEREEVIKTFCL
ncbi:MAG: hypothetical protein ACRCW2_10515 [Cellulosilyticaceae bacterium]